MHHAVCMSQSYFCPLSESSLVIFHSRGTPGLFVLCLCHLKTRAEKRNEGSRKLKSLSETEDLLNFSLTLQQKRLAVSSPISSAETSYT